MTRVKDLIQALAKHGMETQVYLLDDDGDRRDITVSTSTATKGVLLTPTPLFAQRRQT